MNAHRISALAPLALVLLSSGWSTGNAMETDADPSVLLDTVQLDNGGSIQGKVSTISEGRQQFYLVETRDGGILKLRRSQVRHVFRAPPAAAEYLERLGKMPDTVDAHWEMQQWCLENKMLRQREYHMLQVIRLDPDHRDARNKLGYSVYGGVWLHDDHYNQNQGYVKDDRGHWRLPKSIEMEVHEEEVHDRIKSWDVKLRSMIKKYKRRDPSILAEIEAIDDPAAINGLEESFRNERDPELRKVIVETLGNIKSPAAQNALVRIAMAPLQARDVREQCVRLLKQPHFNQTDVVTALLPLLRPKVETSNDAVNTAAWIIGQMGQPSAVPDLISALNTTHKVQIAAAGGNLTVGQGDNGAGLKMGRTPTHQLVEIPNQSVLDALRLLTNARDYGFDERAWLDWYIGTRSIGMNVLNRDE